jgi:adenine-specific DNA methylase
MQSPKIRTVAYKGSKRKLLDEIKKFADEINAKSFFDGFSGTGIVSAHMRSNGLHVTGNDLNAASGIYGNVFLKGYDQTIVKKALSEINSVLPKHGWLTENYSGTKTRIIRGTGGNREERPLAYLSKNAMKLDAARDWVENCSLGKNEKDALIFSILLGADKVFNNSNDQKSSFKEWTTAAKKDVVFISPTFISGPQGTQTTKDIFSITKSSYYDLVYLDPPYTHGVLYPACYHLSDSIALWDKPKLDHTYALPRPDRAAFRTKGDEAGGLYSKKSAPVLFDELIGSFNCKRIVLSYSDAPRNTISIEQLWDICKKHGQVSVVEKNHPICTQSNNLRKISTSLKEVFIVVDR